MKKVALFIFFFLFCAPASFCGQAAPQPGSQAQADRVTDAMFEDLGKLLGATGNSAGACVPIPVLGNLVANSGTTVLANAFDLIVDAARSVSEKKIVLRFPTTEGVLKVQARALLNGQTCIQAVNESRNAARDAEAYGAKVDHDLGVSHNALPVL